jgi:hypothetical protein
MLQRSLTITLLHVLCNWSESYDGQLKSIRSTYISKFCYSHHIRWHLDLDILRWSIIFVPTWKSTRIWEDSRTTPRHHTLTKKISITIRNKGNFMEMLKKNYLPICPNRGDTW